MVRIQAWGKPVCEAAKQAAKRLRPRADQVWKTVASSHLLRHQSNYESRRNRACQDERTNGSFNEVVRGSNAGNTHKHEEFHLAVDHHRRR